MGDHAVGVTDLIIRPRLLEAMLHLGVSCYLRPQLLDERVIEELLSQLGVVVGKYVSEDANTIFPKGIAELHACAINPFCWVEKECTSPDLVV